VGPFSMPLLVTICLGAYFLIVQLVEYGEAPFSLGDGVFGTTFFMLTGLHGLHVFVGVVMLSLCFFRFYSFSPERHVGFECAI